MLKLIHLLISSDKKEKKCGCKTAECIKEEERTETPIVETDPVVVDCPYHKILAYSG